MRRYWIPAAFSHQIAKPDSPPVRVRLMGEDLVLFRDTSGRIGLIEERCPHRTASLFYGRKSRTARANICLRATLPLSKSRRLLLQTLKDHAAGKQLPGMNPKSCRVRSTRVEAPQGTPFAETIFQHVSIDPQAAE